MDILDTPDEQRVIDEVYPECENISVDYAIMEKAKRYSCALLTLDGVI